MASSGVLRLPCQVPHAATVAHLVQQLRLTRFRQWCSVRLSHDTSSLDDAEFVGPQTAPATRQRLSSEPVPQPLKCTCVY